MARPRLLGVLLCYNDGDILDDAIAHLLNNDHDVVVWNHGSTDETSAVLERLKPHLLEATDISRSVDFYDIYPLMSKHLLTHYVDRYDWISWPDQDEILEGDTRRQPYRAFVEEAIASPHGWIEFNDYLYWFTEKDDPSIASPCARLRYYSLARHGSPKIRSWRASATNIRWFNHNRARGSRFPRLFNLRHYPMRSEAQMQRRLAVDRAGLQQGPVNFHYENMKATLRAVDINAASLHYDDGVSDLNSGMKFDWTTVYGTGPALPREVVESYLLPTRRWEIASLLKSGLSRLPDDVVTQHGRARIREWLDALDDRIGCPIMLALKRDEAKIVTEALAREWAAGPRTGASLRPARSRRVDAILNGMPVSVWADAASRSVRVAANCVVEPSSRLPLLALVPCYGMETPRIAAFADGAAEFHGVNGMYYYLACEPGAFEWTAVPPRATSAASRL